MHRSVSTINSDVARDSMGATGRGVVVAVLDSGIDATHPHFRQHRNLELPAGLEHRDFLSPGGGDALVDESGHGTGLASVVAGEYAPEGGATGLERIRDPAMGLSWEALSIPRIAGMAPEATLLSLKVLGADGQGKQSDLLAGLLHLNEVNGRGISLRVHVVLIGLGFEYDATWFACGQSPLCVEAARLVRGGVVVVAASGNTGYGSVNSLSRVTQTVLPYSINDPGNAEPVLTIGSTHRDLPGVYGASYFSSRGPTHDGRPKPDLLAPGDRIMCASSGQRAAHANQNREQRAEYAEDSGTSLAAAHAAGVVAQMLSVRRALHGQPDQVKRLLMDTAQDLGRVREVQGAGMVDALAAVTSTAVTSTAATSPSVPSSAPPSPHLSSRVQQHVGDRELGQQRVASRKARGETVGAVSIMFCYSHQDEVLLDELKTHLSPLRRQGKVDTWWDRRISPGDDWHAEIQDSLATVDIFLILVSASFIDSDYCYDTELQRAVERHNAGEARVVPVIVRPVDYMGTPFDGIQALPKDARPVTSWGNADEAWFDVARGVRRVVEELDVDRRGPESMQ